MLALYTVVVAALWRGAPMVVGRMDDGNVLIAAWAYDQCRPAMSIVFGSLLVIALLAFVVQWVREQSAADTLLRLSIFLALIVWSCCALKVAVFAFKSVMAYR